MSVEKKNADRRLYLLAATVAIVIFLLPLVVRFPLIDPDEGLHATIAQDMVERGDWLVPHHLGKPFLDKPVLYFWCQALSLKCFGMHEFAVRLPGLLLGLLGCVTTGIVGWRMFGRTTGLVSGIFYGTMILPVALAQAAAHDVLLVPCVNLAILLFWEGDTAKSWKASTGFAAAIGIILGTAILAKGLMGVALVGVAYGSYLLVARRFSLAACYRGAVALCIAAAIASIWYVAAEGRNPGYLQYYFIDRHVLGFTTATQRHGESPWWLYLPVLLGGGLPWIGYLPVTIRDCLSSSEPGRSRPRTEAGNPATCVAKATNPTRLLWCWLLACTVLLSLAQSKLITYIWPVFPAVAILAAIGWARLLDGTLATAAKQSLCRNLAMSSCVGPLLLPTVIFVLRMSIGIQFGWPVWIAAILVGLSTLAPLLFFSWRKWHAMLAAGVLATVAQFLVIIVFVVPAVAERYSQKELAEHFNALPAGSPGLPAKMRFLEERLGSFVFYLDPTLRTSIREDQLQEIVRPKNPRPIVKQPFPAGSVVVVPEQRVEKAGGYIDLEGVSASKVGRYRLLQKPGGQTSKIRD